MMSTRAKTLPQKESMVALNFRVPLDLRRRLKLLAAEKGITMTTLIVAAIEIAEKTPAKQGRTASRVKIESNL